MDTIASGDVITDAEGSTSRQWIPNQVVWCRWQSNAANHCWYPALVIDPNDQWVGLDPVKSAYQHVLWLGDGRISQVAENNIQDFCLGFKECYPKMTKAEKYQKAADILIRLAAARADEQMEDEKLVEWANDNLHNFMELSVSNSFYKALGPLENDPSQRSLSRKQIENDRNNSDSSCSGVHDDDENLVYVLSWIRQEDSEGAGYFWPALVTEHDQAGGLVAAELVRKGTTLYLPKEELLDFCTEFTNRIDEKRVINDGQYAMAVAKSIQAVCQQNCIICEEEKPILWAKENILQYEYTRLSQSVVDIMNDKIRPIDADLNGIFKVSALPGSGKPRARKMVKPVISDAFKKYKPKPEGYESDTDLERSEISYEKKKKHKSYTPSSAGLPLGSSPPVKRIVKRAGDINLDDLKIPLDLGWIREVCLRKDQSKKCGDTYYHPPDGHKKLRSMPEVVRYLEANQGKRHVEGLDPATHFCYRETLRTEHENERIRDALVGTGAFGQGKS